MATNIYDDKGFRVKKTDGTTTSWYVRDASGNILATYYKDASNPVHLDEVNLFGASRLGMAQANTSGTINKYVYELTDHLGNVRSTIFKDASNALIIESYADYYPFGMVIPTRNQPASKAYRFGYQGQFAEKDEETGLDHFDFRDYDPRLGRWLIPDPMGQYWSPYMAMGNNPVNILDPNGAWGDDPEHYIDGNGVDQGIMIPEVVIIPQQQNWSFSDFMWRMDNALQGHDFYEQGSGLYLHGKNGGGFNNTTARDKNVTDFNVDDGSLLMLGKGGAGPKPSASALDPAKTANAGKKAWENYKSEYKPKLRPPDSVEVKEISFTHGLSGWKYIDTTTKKIPDTLGHPLKLWKYVNQ